MTNANTNRTATSASQITKPGAVAPIAWSTFSTDLRTRRPITVHTVLAPRRFDVHRVSEVAAWLDQAETLGASALVVDLSEVRFIDQAALDAIDMLFTQPSVRVECVNPSPAFSLTARLISQATSGSAATSALSLSRQAEPLPQSPDAAPLTVVVGGDLTIANAHEFRAKLDTVLADDPAGAHKRVVIDLSSVDQLDAAGLMSVTSAMLDMRRHGHCVHVVEPRQRKAVEFARLTGVLPKLTTPTC